MSMHGEERSILEDLELSRNRELFRHYTPKPPLGILNDHIDEWAERDVSISAVFTALRNVVSRPLTENEARNAAVWMEQELERHETIEGESLWQQQ